MSQYLDPQFSVAPRGRTFPTVVLMGLPFVAAVVAAALNVLAGSESSVNCGSVSVTVWKVVLGVTCLGALTTAWRLWERTTVTRVLGSVAIAALTLGVAVFVSFFAILFSTSGACFD